MSNTLLLFFLESESVIKITLHVIYLNNALDFFIWMNHLLFHFFICHILSQLFHDQPTFWNSHRYFLVCIHWLQFLYDIREEPIVEYFYSLYEFFGSDYFISFVKFLWFQFNEIEMWTFSLFYVSFVTFHVVFIYIK